MNAVIYARYSSHGQTEQSIEGQLRDNYAWAKQQGITIVGEYIDRALSGTKDQRPDFQRMVEDAAKRQFELVIVWKLDRFARNRYDSAIYKARLKKYGVRVVSVKENIADSPEGIILEGLLESMAEYYSANLSQNIRRGQRENIEKGMFCGGSIPFGYKVQDKRLVIDDKTAPIARFVFEQYAQGVTKKEIINHLNRLGVRNRSGKPLTYTAFAHMLSNTTYIGQYKYNGKIVPGVAQQLIDNDIFEKVQQRLATTRRAPAASKGEERYLLQGKIFCGHCGRSMVGESGRSQNGNVYHYYACSAKKKRLGCRKKNERKDLVEQYVVCETLKYMNAPGRIAQVAKAVVNEYNKAFSDDQVGALEKALAQIDREMDKLVDALIEAPKAAHKKIYDRMESLDAQKTDVELSLSKLRIAQSICLTESEVRTWLKDICTGDPENEDFRQRIIDVFINSIYLYDDRAIIFYNIKEGKQITHADLLTALSSPPASTSNSSDLNANGVPNAMKSELSGSDFLHYIFVKGVFGIIIPRSTI